MRGKHAPTQARRRRYLGVPVAVWIGFTVSTLVAVAAFLSFKTTPPKTVTAAAVGTVDIGNLESLGFIDDALLLQLQPGASVTKCGLTNVDAVAATGPGDYRLFFNGAATGGLAEFLTVELTMSTPLSVGTAGRETCTGPLPTTLFTGNLDDIAAAHGSYASGVVIGAPPVGEVKSFRFRLTVALPDTPEVGAGASGQSATMPGFTFENH